jgi:hypothetical protein
MVLTYPKGTKMSAHYEKPLCFLTLTIQPNIMGFSFFGKKEKDSNSAVFRDRVYMRTTAKMSACLALAEEQPHTVFITWFSETSRKFREYFSAHGLTEINIIEAHHINTGTLLNKTIVFAEHHPLHDKEKALVANWQQNDLLVFSGLDEPLFARFGSDRIISLMQKLGMKEDEAIEHTMITKSIQNAQQKIAKHLMMEQSANSQADWMLKNVKG